tara:strand:- start:1483 stop:1689 length:207 start_codon:yes stop_codon:yes gene_type:complete
MNKLGPYISKLMTTVLDFKEDLFVRGLAIGELKRLNVDIEEFIRKQHQHEDEDEEETKTEKTLLQEDK